MMASKFNNDDVMQDNVDDAVGGRTGNKCDPCSRRKRTSHADLFCKTCSEFLCNDCCEAHKIYKPGGHDISLVSETKSGTIVADMKGLDRCQEHDKVFVFFCEDHDDMCCEICALANHRKCDNLKDIANEVTKENQDLSTLNQKINSTVDEASNFVKQIIYAVTKTKNKMSEICMEMDAYKEQINAMFENAKKKVIQELTNTTNKEKTRYDSKQLAANEARDSLEATRSIVHAVNQHGSAIQKFMIKHVLKKRLQDCRRVMEGLRQDDHAVNMNLVWNENVHILLSLKDAICDLVVRSEDKVLSVEKIAGTGSSSEQQIPCRPVRLELLKTMALVKTREDNVEPFVTGLDFLPDGRIVAVDNLNWTCFIMSNTLKRSDPSYKLETKPFDVTFYSDESIAVSTLERTICLLTVDSKNKITLMRKLTTSSCYFSICPLNDRTFVVSTWDDPRHARMIDVDGHESDFDKVKFPSKTYKGDESKCTYISSRSSLVMLDRYAHIVYTYNTVNGASSEIKDARIQKPRGACVGPDDSVFVCSQNTESVIQISPTGDVCASCDVGMMYPYAIAISRDGTRMAVTNNESSMKLLKLFKITQ
ncbi:uncharacterized protein LOC128220573 [Mya arenaria]|uniref:uncharacterized protein LOC128220573 n=1 Tax=Mya arenaria TaxID=6604 RepID=UPI0022E34E11|nr:uncharacterized protein LOC128220573 [Mya arenaria]